MSKIKFHALDTTVGISFVSGFAERVFALHRPCETIRRPRCFCEIPNLLFPDLGAGEPQNTQAPHIP